MKTTLTMMSVGLWLVLNGCNTTSESTDPRTIEADEIDQIVAALTADPAGAVDGVASDPMLADDGDGGTVGDHHRRHGRGPQRGDHRGRGVGPRDLILWYGDLTALQACRDERDACLASGATTCDDSARDCVRAVLEGAFDAMCEDRTASCADAGTSDGACGRIIDRCAAGLPGAGGDGGWSGGHHGGGQGHFGHGGRNCDGGMGMDDDGDNDESPAADASVPTP